MKNREHDSRQGNPWRKSNMFIPTIIMGVIALVLLYVGYSRGQQEHISGLSAALKMVIEILPLLLFAFIISGMVQVLMPRELLAKLVGTEAGMRGILLGTIAGGLTPGGPYVSLPIAAGLLRSGASIGTMVAFITGWSLWAVTRLPMEVGMMGWRFTLIRLISVFLLPVIAGSIAQAIASYFK
ncbi:MAG: permease [Candidatus Omnitrophota bacterium]